MEPEQKRLHIHRFTIDEKAKRPAKGLLYYKRKFIHVYSRGKDVFQASNETIIRTPRLDFGLRMRIGNAGSETPWNWIIQFFGLTTYLQFGRGRRLAHWITSRKGGWHHRELGFHTYGEEGQAPDLVWDLWYDDDDHKRTPKWRHGRITLSPAEWLWGPLRYRYQDIASFETDIEMKEGSYPATIKLQKMTRGRENRRTKKFTHIQESKYTLDVDVPKGVPSHYDKSGGWKGDRTYGFGVAFDYPRAGVSVTEIIDNQWGIQVRGVPEWQIDAKAAVEAWVMTRRAKTGFREPQEVD